MLLVAHRIFAWSVAIGGISFAIGFFGPIIVAPDANQGPLLGILITGPLGVVAGFLVGIVRAMVGYSAGPVEVLRRWGLPTIVAGNPSRLLRPLSALVGGILAVYGIAGVLRGEGRGAAAAIVISAAAIYYAFTGSMPAWFRR